jgi:hypothetical protein
VESALTLGATLVRVRFTDLVDFTYAPTLLASNYTIPGLTVSNVVQESAQSVVLTTTFQQEIPYTVTVADGKSLNVQPLDASLSQATFMGYPTSARFTAVPTGVRRLRAIFNVPLVLNAALSNPLSYAVKDIDGTTITVVSATPEQATNPTSVMLLLGSDLQTTTFYQLSVAVPTVLISTQGGLPIFPATMGFQWVRTPLTVSIPVEAFSGEVEGDLYGLHNGLVFFSPALQAGAANSIIQIEDIDVCTRAFDEYHFPQPIDPAPLFTHGGGIVPNAYPGVLNTAVLWASFPRLVDARLTVTLQPTDTVPVPVDGPATATFREPWDADYVSLLNNTFWKTFDNAGEPPMYFKTALNTAPIPPGPTVTIILHSGPGREIDEEIADTLVVADSVVTLKTP